MRFLGTQFHRRRRADGSRDERGAVAIIMSITIAVLLIPLAALTVDLGMQRVVRQDMQSVADTVALDMARVLGSGRNPTPSEAAASAALIKGTVGGTPTLTVRAGYIGGDSAFVSDQSLGCGTGPAYNTWFRQVPPLGASTNAVLVTSSSSVSFLFENGAGAACRSSIARVEANACFKLGSYAASVNSGKSALLNPIVGKLLGGSLDLRALGYEGLATAQLSLADLVAIPGLGVATPEALLTTPVRMGTLYLAMAQALTKSGDTVRAQILQTVAANLGPLANKMITVGDLIGIEQGNQAALTTGLNVLDLVTGGLILANGTSAIDIPGLNVALPILGTGLRAQLNVLQQPQQACGRVGQAKAKTAQIGLEVTGSLVNTPDLGLLALTVGQVNVSANVAQATGTLTRAQCAAATPPGLPHQLDVSVATALAGSVALKVPVTVKGNLGLASVDLQLMIATTTQAGAETGLAQLNLPPNDTVPLSTGSEFRLAKLGATNVTITGGGVKLLGIPLLGPELLAFLTGSIIDPLLSGLITPILNPLVDSLNNALLGPLSDLLGLNLAGADVYGVRNQQSPVCGLPRLAG